jgi:ribonucleoside-diphosphate reductase alpha chain
MQAVFQKYVDNSVSKPINLPTEATPDTIEKIYWLSHELKCKGITVYRYGSKKEQVLTIAGQQLPQTGEEVPPYLTVESEYAGGCATGTCPF